MFGRGNAATYILNHFTNDGSDWFYKNGDGLTPLHLACMFGYSNIVEDLFLAKCPSKELYMNDYDALYLAANAGHCNVIAVFHKMLPKVPCIPCGERKWTALDLAVCRKDVLMIEYLLKNCDVNVKSPIDGKTAFARAAENATGKEDVHVLRLFYARAVPKPRDSDGSPLWGESKTGLNLDTQDHDGMTPLMWLAHNNKPDLVREVLYFGADVSLKNKEGNTAQKYALSSPEVAKTLEEATNNPNFKNRIYYRLITRKAITLHETRNMKVPVDNGILNKSAVVECLYEDEKKAHVKHYERFGWIPTGSPENKSPLVRPDAILMTFERFLENQSRFTPKKLRDMKYFQSLRKEYIDKFTSRGLPEPAPIPPEANEIWQQEQNKKKKKSPIEEYILTDAGMKELGIIDHEFENRRPFPEMQEDYIKKPEVVFIHIQRDLHKNQIEFALGWFDQDKPVTDQAQANKITYHMLEKIERYVHRNTIVVAWDIKECLKLLDRKHSRLIDVNNLYKNYRQDDVKFRGNTRLELKEVAALILPERLSENSLIQDHMRVVQKLMSLYICTNVEEERTLIRKNEPEEPDLLAINGWRTKQDLIDAKCKALRKTYQHIMNSSRTDPLTGPNVVRVHVKKVEHLKSIEKALKDLENPKKENIEIRRMSIAVSMKTKSQKKGFFVYLKLQSDQHAKRTIDFFQDRNRSELAFKAEKAQGKISDAKKTGSVRDNTPSIRSNTAGTNLKSRGSEKSKHGLNPSAAPYDQRSFSPPRPQYDPYMPYMPPQHYNSHIGPYSMYGVPGDGGYAPMMPPHYSQQPPSMMPIIRKAKDLYNCGRFDDAIKTYKEAIKMYPKNKDVADWHMEIAEIFVLDKHQMSSAQKHLDIASRKNEGLKSCVQKLRDIYADNGYPPPEPPMQLKPSYTHHDDMDYGYMEYDNYNWGGFRHSGYPEPTQRSGRPGLAHAPDQSKSSLYRPDKAHRSGHLGATSPQPPDQNKGSKI